VVEIKKRGRKRDSIEGTTGSNKKNNIAELGTAGGSQKKKQGRGKPKRAEGNAMERKVERRDIWGDYC